MVNSLKTVACLLSTCFGKNLVHMLGSLSSFPSRIENVWKVDIWYSRHCEIIIFNKLKIFFFVVGDVQEATDGLIKR